MAENKALYQKYRPRKLSEIVGQEHIKKTIANAVEQKKLTHAYMFVGTRGVSKTTMARIMTRIFNCEGGPSINYSDDDKIVKMIDDGTFPDIKELDAASNSSVEDLRTIVRESYNAPIIGKKRVFIIDECLPFDSEIKLANGDIKKIGDIVNSEENIFVMSYNFQTKIIEPKKVIRKITINNDKVMKKITVRTKTGEIKELRITDNHTVFDENGNEVKVKDLTVGKKLNILKK